MSQKNNADHVKNLREAADYLSLKCILQEGATQVYSAAEEMLRLQEVERKYIELVAASAEKCKECSELKECKAKLNHVRDTYFAYYKGPMSPQAFANEVEKIVYPEISKAHEAKQKVREWISTASIIYPYTPDITKMIELAELLSKKDG